MRQIGDVIVIGERPIILEKTKTNYFYEGVKRVFDIIVALIALLFLIPVTIIVKIVTLLSKDTKSIFYQQTRIGKDGEKFKIYKFRSMVTDADKRLEELLRTNKEAREEWDKNQKLTNDPRITKIGKILRKTSLDELPQFINILKGDMSMIGPRPLVQGELEKFGGDHYKYEQVRPGITGWWACNGRSVTTYQERLNLEYYYVANRSIRLDIKCMFKTIGAVIKGHGAK